MAKLIRNNQLKLTSKQTELLSIKISSRRLVKFCKLGKPPASAGDIKSILRSLIQSNPIAFESRIKEVISTSSGFNEQSLEEAISDYNNDQSNESFEKVFTSISDGLNEAINKRRSKAEEIIRRNGYKIQSLGNNTFQVKDLEDQDTYQVNLTNETCTCMDFQRLAPLSLWCKHLYGSYAITKNLQDIS